MHGDERRVKQIILNILNNAIKFTLTGGITIETKVKENIVKIIIVDTGIGIKEENMPKLFTEFCTISECKLLNPNGTGLGLYLSKQLAQLMKGDIVIKSIYGKGTKVILILPLEEPSMELNITEEPLYKLKQSNSIIGNEFIKNNNCCLAIYDKTPDTMIKPLDEVGSEDEKLSSNLNLTNNDILIVEDDPMNAFILKKMIQNYSFNADKATNGKQAVELVKEKAKFKKFYSLILMDLNMPVMSGLEVLLSND